MQWSFPVRYVPKHAAWLGSSVVFDFGLSWVGQDALHNLEIFIWNTALSAAPLGNLYLEYCTFCCTTWKSFSEILHFLLHCLQIIISNATLSTALKKKIIKKIQYVMKVNGGRCTIHWHNSKSGSLWWHISHHVWRREKMNELGRKKLGQTHAVGKECKAIVSLSPDRDSPRQLWGLCRGNHDFCRHSTPPCEPNRWEAAATYVCVCTYSRWWYQPHTEKQRLYIRIRQCNSGFSLSDKCTSLLLCPHRYVYHCMDWYPTFLLFLFVLFCL